MLNEFNFLKKEIEKKLTRVKVEKSLRVDEKINWIRNKGNVSHLRIASIKWKRPMKKRMKEYQWGKQWKLRRTGTLNFLL